MNNIFIDLLAESKVVIVYRKHLFRVFLLHVHYQLNDYYHNNYRHHGCWGGLIRISILKKPALIIRAGFFFVILLLILNCILLLSTEKVMMLDMQ